MTEAEKQIVAALKMRLAEMDKERSWISSKIAEYEGEPEGSRSLFPVATLAPALKGHRFAPNPHSRASRMLEAARKIVEHSPGQKIAFLDLYAGLPRDLVPQTKNSREITRRLLREDGHRVGLVYVNANMITLKNSPHLASAG